MKVTNKRIELFILIAFLIGACSTKPPNKIDSRDDALLLKKMKCRSYQDFHFSGKQKRALNKGIRHLFGEKKNVSKFCYQYKVNQDGRGLIVAFNFSAHQTSFLFLLGKETCYVLQSEAQPKNLKDSFEKAITFFGDDFDHNTVEEMRKNILSRMGETN
jgi:hypothetical protein